MQAAFAFELRVVTCTECGAPVEVGEAGGALACAYCKSPQRPRAASRAVPRAPALPEPQRIALLGAQDRAPLAPPADLASLFVGLQLLPWKMGDALSAWKRVRDRVMAAGAPDDEERLQLLTLALAEHFARENHPLRERSLLESALEACRTPRHRQSLCAALSRSACRLGDLAAAEAWLSLCDPASHDLLGDTAWRFARARLDTAHGRFDAVLGVLGAHDGAVPLDDRWEPSCVALRAHALEQLGQLDAAVMALDQFFVRASAHQRYSCQTYVAELGLCARSAPAALSRQRERGLRAVGRASGAPFLGLGLAFGALVLGALLGVPLLWFENWGMAHFAVGLGGLLAVVFFAVGVIQLGKWRFARRLRTSGVPMLARIVHARGTNQRTKGIPQLLYRVLVMPSVGAPFLAHAVFLADATLRARFTPGALVIVRLDPNRRHLVQLELD